MWIIDRVRDFSGGKLITRKQAIAEYARNILRFCEVNEMRNAALLKVRKHIGAGLTTTRS